MPSTWTEELTSAMVSTACAYPSRSVPEPPSVFELIVGVSVEDWIAADTSEKFAALLDRRDDPPPPAPVEIDNDRRNAKLEPYPDRLSIDILDMCGNVLYTAYG